MTWLIAGLSFLAGVATVLVVFWLVLRADPIRSRDVK